MTHTADHGFLEPSDKMIAFLQSRVDDLKFDGDVVKKHIKKSSYCMLKSTDTVADALALFKKLKCVGIIIIEMVGPKRYGLLSVFDVIGVSKTAVIGDVKHGLATVSFCAPLDDFKSLDPNKIWLCTDTGESDGKLLGRVWTRDNGGIC